MISAKELAKIFDEIEPNQEHYFDMPDSEIVQIKPYSIVFPYQFEGELPRENFFTDGRFFTYFSKIGIKEIGCKNGTKVIGIYLYKRKDDQDVIANFYVQGKIKNEKKKERQNENKTKKKR